MSHHQYRWRLQLHSGLSVVVGFVALVLLLMLVCGILVAISAVAW